MSRLVSTFNSKSIIEAYLSEGSGEGDMMDDLLRVEEESQIAFHRGDEHQPWKLVPKAKLVRLYRENGKYGRINEGILADVWSILQECVLKVCLNSDVRHGLAAASFFEVDEYGDIDEKTWDRWFAFIRDGSASKAARTVREIGGGGSARYSDQSSRLSKLLSQAYSAERQGPEQLLLAMDRILNFAHGIGRMAHWFVEGGTSTLDEIADFAPKGITAGGLR